MKNSNQILSHLYFVNSDKLKIAKCLNILKALLPARLKDFISYIYKKDNTIFIAINQHTFKMEFNYRKDLIKSLLNDIAFTQKDCKMLENCVVKVYVSQKKRDKAQEIRISYKERADGNFINTLKEEHFEILEKIRIDIRKTKK